MSIRTDNAAIEARNRARREADRRRQKKAIRQLKGEFVDVYGVGPDETEPCKSCRLCEDK